MAIYKIKELIDSLSSAQKDGFEYVELNESQDDDSNSLSLDYLEEANSSENDIINSISLPDGYVANLRY